MVFLVILGIGRTPVYVHEPFKIEDKNGDDFMIYRSLLGVKECSSAPRALHLSYCDMCSCIGGR